MCRSSVRADHPFHQKDQCGDTKCIHIKLCGVCGLVGNPYGTQTYALDLRHLKDGRLLHKTCKRNLDGSVFVYVMMKDDAVMNLVDNTQCVLTADSEIGAWRRRNVSRLWANTRAQGVGIGESIRMLKSNGSQASVVQGNKKVAFEALVEVRDEGAVDANRRAANAAESDVAVLTVKAARRTTRLRTRTGTVLWHCSSSRVAEAAATVSAAPWDGASACKLRPSTREKESRRPSRRCAVTRERVGRKCGSPRTQRPLHCLTKRPSPSIPKVSGRLARERPCLPRCRSFTTRHLAEARHSL